MIKIIAGVSCLMSTLAMVSCGGERETESGDPYLATLELDATYPEPFSYLSRVRELAAANGRGRGSSRPPP